MGFLSGIHLIGAAFGFVAGVVGFIIVRFWIRPVSAYGRLKRRIEEAVGAHLSELSGTAPDPSVLKETQRRLRRLAGELTDAWHQDLPQWYRIRLRAREEKPAEAAAGLMKLSGSRQAEPAQRGAAKIRSLLLLGNGKS